MENDTDNMTTDPALTAPDGSEIDEHDPMNDPEYHAYLEVLAKDCKCAEKPCDGCMAGAPCDADTYGDGLEGWDLYSDEDLSDEYGADDDF